MTNYPVAMMPDDPEFSAGEASTRKEAIQIYNHAVDGWTATSAELTETEVGRVYKTEDEARKVWTEELEAGYGSIIHVWAGFKAVLEYWKIEADECEWTTP